MQSDTSHDLTLLDYIKPLYDKYLIDSDGFPGFLAKFIIFFTKTAKVTHAPPRCINLLTPLEEWLL